DTSAPVRRAGRSAHLSLPARRASDLGLVLLYGLLGAPGGEEIERGVASEPRGYYLVDAVLTEMGADGLPRVVVRADSIEQQLAEDRKSTRLNSSHVKISYAVFCLKKK